MTTEKALLDASDFQIINRLVANGRESFSDLGKAIGLSPHGAADRVRRLERAGVITRFTAVVDLANVGRTLNAYVDVRLLTTTVSTAFESFVLQLPAVQDIAFVTGRFDYLVHVACRSTDDLDRTVRAIRTDGGAALTETRIVLRAAMSAHGFE
jgi:Lrp/AsnC family transcriptional regulator, leucine-responsive regulatory protein